MADFKRPHKGGGGSKDDDDDHPFSRRPQVQKIFEPRCLTCKHEQRDRIDYMLAMRTPYVEIHRLHPDVSEKSIANHAKEHLSFEDEGMKRIIEHEAGIAKENLDAGLQGVFLRRTVLDMAIKKVTDRIASGEIEIEVKDLPKMIELREKLDSQSASAQIETYELQFNAFKDAIEQIVAPEVMFQILERTKEILQSKERPAIQSGD